MEDVRCTDVDTLSTCAMYAIDTIFNREGYVSALHDMENGVDRVSFPSIDQRPPPFGYSDGVEAAIEAITKRYLEDLSWLNVRVDRSIDVLARMSELRSRISEWRDIIKSEIAKEASQESRG